MVDEYVIGRPTHYIGVLRLDIISVKPECMLILFCTYRGLIRIQYVYRGPSLVLIIREFIQRHHGNKVMLYAHDTVLPMILKPSVDDGVPRRRESLSQKMRSKK